VTPHRAQQPIFKSWYLTSHDHRVNHPGLLEVTVKTGEQTGMKVPRASFSSFQARRLYVISVRLG
jgi:hypothetical protein